MMALKLDMSKAYDRIEWNFVVGVLKAMGFQEAMVQFIFKCMSTVSYQILINGRPSRSFSPERGLRQGDPLFPYLFVLCADVLSGLFKEQVNGNKIHGIQVARRAPQISHIFFADDSLLFARANPSEADCIMETLSKYQATSGQLVNLEKSEASFNRNVLDEVKDMIRNRMKVKIVLSHSKYLGLPVVFGRSKKEVFSFVLDRVWKKIKGWKERFLSRAGKETLIKAVAQTIPTYIMSCYKLPDGCCKDIKSMLAKFWWGSKEGERKIHWMSWERMSKSKNSGDMGFRGVGDFNMALLGKHYWRLLTGEETLMGRVFKSRYYPRCSILEAKVGFSPSYAWRSIISAKDLVSKGLRWRISNGESVKIWGDNWLPNQSGFKLHSPVRILVPEAKVEELIDRDLRQWRRDLIFTCFNTSEATQIVSIPLSVRLSADKINWHSEKDGEYSVRSAYHVLGCEKSMKKPGPSTRSHCNLWKEIWHTPIQNQVKNFIWRLAKNILPTKCNLLKKGVHLDPICPLCSSCAEDNSHMFMHCDFAKMVWFSSPLGIHVPAELDVNDWLLHWLSCKNHFAIQVFCTTLWKIWSARNQCLFKQQKHVPHEIAADSLDFVLEFNKASPCKKNLRQQNQSAETEPVYRGFNIIQVDAGCFVNGTVALGCVLKNHADEVILSASNRESIAADPATAEALAIR